MRASDDTGAMTTDDFDRLFEATSRWGRWGATDTRGSLNTIESSEVVAASTLVRDGQQISLGRTIETMASADVPRPALHYMVDLGDRGSGEPTGHTDFIGIDFHGKFSHLDALGHIAYRGQFYNGMPARGAVTSAGSSFAPVSDLAAGIVTRGVLLDPVRRDGADWLEPPRAISAAELERTAERQGVELHRGDAVLVRTGQPARRRARGPAGLTGPSVGLHPYAFAWLAEHDIAILGGDGNSDVRPPLVEGVSSPVHVLALVATGMCLLDSLDLEALGDACAKAERWEFLLIVLPLIIPGGTGSPVNPVAVL